MTDGARRDGHHVGLDGRYVKREIVKPVMLLYMDVVVLSRKVDAKYILLLLLPLFQQVHSKYIQHVMCRFLEKRLEDFEDRTVYRTMFGMTDVVRPPCQNCTKCFALSD